MAADPHFLRNKVESRLKELGRSPTEAARRGELEPDFIRDILRNRKRSVQGTNLAKLAKGLDWEPSDLLDAERPPVRQQTVGGELSPIYIKGEVAAGNLVDTTTEAHIPYDVEISPFPPDPRFPVEAQFDLIVKGTSINRFAREGQRIRCVALQAYPHPIEPDEMVVVERFRGDLRERTAKRFRQLANNVVELWPDSDDPRWKEPIRVEEGVEAGDSIVQIVAIVLYVYDRPRK